MKVIITGGRDIMTSVSVYGLNGWEEDLPSLNIGRRNHACSSFLAADGTKVKSQASVQYSTTGHGSSRSSKKVKGNAQTDKDPTSCLLGFLSEPKMNYSDLTCNWRHKHHEHLT